MLLRATFREKCKQMELKDFVKHSYRAAKYDRSGTKLQFILRFALLENDIKYLFS